MHLFITGKATGLHTYHSHHFCPQVTQDLDDLVSDLNDNKEILNFIGTAKAEYLIESSFKKNHFELITITYVPTEFI